MTKPALIAVIGSQSSGKTTAIETLTRELTKRGYRIAAVKHIPEPDFTIDKEGKDTWRFAQSGAQTIVSVAAHETATIEKKSMDDFSLEELLEKCKGSDIVFIEGFRTLAGKNKNILKIVAVKSAEEAFEAVKNFEGIIAFSGPYSTEKMNPKIPYIDALKNPEEIADIVEKAIR